MHSRRNPALRENLPRLQGDAPVSGGDCLDGKEKEFRSLGQAETLELRAKPRRRFSNRADQIRARKISGAALRKVLTNQNSS